MKDGRVCKGRTEGSTLAPELRVLNPCELVLVMRCRGQGAPRVRDGHDAGGR